jgi:hypothetical protein
MRFAISDRALRRFLAACCLCGALAPATAQVVPQVPQIPAFLPMVDTVAATPPQPLDGTWLITSIRKKIRIEGGRAYAIDGWVHMMVLKIEPGMVVIKDIAPTAPGKYTGYDLPLLGTWDARVEADRSISVTVKTSMLPVSYKLVPLQLDNPQWYAQEMRAAGLQVPQNEAAPRAPAYQPAPPTYQPQPAPPAYQPQPAPPAYQPQPAPPAYQPQPAPPAYQPQPPPPAYQPPAPPAAPQVPQSSAFQLRYAQAPPAASSAPRSMTRARGATSTGNTERVCRHEGGEGEPLCERVPATDEGAYNVACGGRQLYLSDGKCYLCPDGYKRANILRKMAGDPHACEKRGFHTQVYLPATFKRIAFGCAPGEFQYKSRCMSCPSRFNRVHFLMFDAGSCRVPNDLQCMGDLEPAKQPPANLIQRIGNWAGLRSRKLCAPPFDINLFALQSVSNVGVPLVVAIGTFAYKMAANDRATRDKVAHIKADLKAHRLKRALAEIRTFEEFPMLVQAAHNAGMVSLSVGIGVDASALAGFNYEIGLAFDLASLLGGGEPKWLKLYQSTGITKGVSLSADGGIAIGAWGGRFTTGYSQGFVAATGNIPLPPPLPPADVGIGVWTSYYTPKGGQPRLLGFTGNAGMGAGFELAEYDEIYTKVSN